MHRQLLKIVRTVGVASITRCKHNFPSFSTVFNGNFQLKKNHQFIANLSSFEGKMVQEVDYEGLIEAQKDDSVVIIDVREQKEINETGKLPGSIHIPMGSVRNVLETVSSDDFIEKYGKLKPGKETKIILSCRSGGRSRMVQEELHKVGYANAWNYTGGWSEWESKQKC